MNDDLIFRQCKFDSDEEWNQFMNLQNEVYKDRNVVFHRDGFYKWFIENPVGKVISYGAFEDGLMIANYSCVPKKMIIEGRVVKGLLSMATVTHPKYRGRGLFKTLAQMTYSTAKKEGYEFVVGVANANSFHGFIKYFPFTFVGKLQVKIGYGNNIIKNNGIVFEGYNDVQTMRWRLSRYIPYHKTSMSIEGKYKHFARTFMGVFDKKILDTLIIPKAHASILPKIYVGLGADLKSPYINIPKFIKRSPFNLIFMDLTGGRLPKVTNNNIFFQLWDFDVA